MEQVATEIERDRTLAVVDGDQRDAITDDLVLKTQRLGTQLRRWDRRLDPIH